MASGKPAARPRNPLVMWLGLNGTRLRWPPFLISTATETTISTSISNAKKKPASFVDTPTQRPHHDDRPGERDEGRDGVGRVGKERRDRPAPEQQQNNTAGGE